MSFGILKRIIISNLILALAIIWGVVKGIAHESIWINVPHILYIYKFINIHHIVNWYPFRKFGIKKMTTLLEPWKLIAWFKLHQNRFVANRSYGLQKIKFQFRSIVWHQYLFVLTLALQPNLKRRSIFDRMVTWCLWPVTWWNGDDLASYPKRPKNLMV